jgi:anti-sigma B factor antagonist
VLVPAESVAARERRGDVLARRLGVQPLAHVALGGAGPLGQLGGGERARVRQLAIEAEAVADHDERGVHGGAELDDGLAEERVQPLLVDCGGCSHGGDAMAGRRRSPQGPPGIDSASRGQTDDRDRARGRRSALVAGPTRYDASVEDGRHAPDGELKIVEHRVGHRLLLAPRGEIDLASVATLRSALEHGSAAGVAEVWLDLSDVEFMDSTGLTALLEAHRNGVARLTLICPPGPVRRLLDIAGFDRVLPIHDSRAAAQAAT